MKKRHILYGLVAIEIVSLPFSAGAIHHVFKSQNQYVTLTEIPSEPGVSRLVISSNAPFTLSSEGASTLLDIRVNVSGSINDTRFGDSAQMPGLPAVCADLSSQSRSAVYSSYRATAVEDNDILSQSVIFEVHYSADTAPIFSVHTEKEGRNIPKAPACGAT